LVPGQLAQEVIDGEADPSCFNGVCQLNNAVEDADVQSGGIEFESISVKSSNISGFA
jgi:hypothetical protein